jgi:hypothetical protein
VRVMGCEAVPALGPSKTTGVTMLPVGPPLTVTGIGVAVYIPGGSAMTSPGWAFCIAIWSELPSHTTLMFPVGVGHAYVAPGDVLVPGGPIVVTPVGHPAIDPELALDPIVEPEEEELDPEPPPLPPPLPPLLPLLPPLPPPLPLEDWSPPLLEEFPPLLPLPDPDDEPPGPNSRLRGV